MKKNTGLSRDLNFPMLLMYGVGLILGAGIYSLMGEAQKIAGQDLWISIILAAISILSTSLSYAELATMYPQVGGEFIYLKNAFPRTTWIGNAAGLAVLASGVLATTTVALGFSIYFSIFINLPSPFIGAVLILSFALINAFGVVLSARLNFLITVLEIAGLLIFSYYALFGIASYPDVELPVTNNWIMAAGLIIFAFFGFESIVNFVEEVKDPARDLPRALWGSVLITALLYFIVALGTQSLAGIQEVHGSSTLSSLLRPLAPHASVMIAVIALFSTANTALISLATSSRVALALARSHILPRQLVKISKKYRTPNRCLVVTALLSMILLWCGQIQPMALASSTITLFVFFLINLALVRLRFTAPNTPRPFRSPLSIKGVPILPLIGVATSLLLMAFNLLQILKMW